MATPRGYKKTDADRKYAREWASRKRIKQRRENPDYWKQWTVTPEQIEKRRQAVRKVREDKLEILRVLKEQPCADCGREFPYCVMEFDHKIPRKGRLFNWAGKGLDTILKEMEVCDVVCANCHRIRECVRAHASGRRKDNHPHRR